MGWLVFTQLSISLFDHPPRSFCQILPLSSVAGLISLLGRGCIYLSHPLKRYSKNSFVSYIYLVNCVLSCMFSLICNPITIFHVPRERGPKPQFAVCVILFSSKIPDVFITNWRRFLA